MRDGNSRGGGRDEWRRAAVMLSRRLSTEKAEFFLPREEPELLPQLPSSAALGNETQQWLATPEEDGERSTGAACWDRAGCGGSWGSWRGKGPRGMPRPSPPQHHPLSLASPG